MPMNVGDFWNRFGTALTNGAAEVSSDIATLGRTVVTTNWAGGIRDAFARVTGRPDLSNVPAVDGAVPPDPETVAVAKAILKTARQAVFNRLEFYPRAVLDQISTLDPSSPVIEEVLRTVDPLCQKHLVEETYEKMGPDWMKRFTLPAREIVTDLAAHCITVPTDRAVYDALIGGVHDDRFAEQRAMLSDPQGRVLLRNRLMSLGTESEVSFRGAPIAVDKPAGSQPLFNLMYDGVERSANDRTTAPDVAMAVPLAKSETTGQTAHLEGTTIFRPGLGNLTPSAASLFRLAQYSDKLVLTYECTDGTDASKLRPLTEYKGVPVPPELAGKLFAIGTADHRLQDGKRGAGVLIAQLAEIARDGQQYGLDASHLTMVAHSQGNLETVYARSTLAANGFPDVIDRHIALAPAVRGSFFASDPIVEGKAFAVGGQVAMDSIRHLQPDYAEANTPELMRATVDMSMLGTVQQDLKPAFVSPLMVLSNVLTNKDLSGVGSDGLVDTRIRDFVKDPSKFFLSDQAYDHLSIITDPSAIDAMMTHVEPKDPETLSTLQTLVDRS